MSDESPSSTACRTVYTILFGEYWRQPHLDACDSCIISYFTWLIIEHAIKKITQGEGVTEIDCTR